MTEEGRVVGITHEELLDWLRAKVTEAEKAVATREQMAETWRRGTDAEWIAAAGLHPSTAGKSLGKASRKKEATMHDRIAIRMRRDLAMLRLALQHAQGPSAAN